MGKKINKKRAILFFAIIGLFIAACLIVQGILLAKTDVDDNEVKAYAAAFGSLERYEGKSEEQLMKTAESYLKRKAIDGSNELARLIRDGLYGAGDLPLIYGSIPELKSGLEESLEILADYDHLMEGKAEPEMEGYTKEDFYQMLDERITAEENILNELNNDPNPDLFQYAYKLYQERNAHPVIY